MSNLHVRDLMTSKVVSVSPDEAISNVQELMDKKRIRHIAVVDAKRRVLGVVSQRDVQTRSLFEDTGTVADIMAWKTKTIRADEALSKAARIMLDHKYGCLPVVEGGRLAGILTEADFVKYLSKTNNPIRRRTGGR
jgi:CBS domain-containing membrane protein